MTKLGLTLNEVKTSLKDARMERFDFLGYTFGPHCYQRNGKRYLGASRNCSSPHPGGAVEDDLTSHRVAWRKLLDQVTVGSILIMGCLSFPTSTT
jgi:hypothetical protein